MRKLTCHILHGCDDIDQHLIGAHETAASDTFSYGAANRDASIRIPTNNETIGCAQHNFLLSFCFLVQRRPSCSELKQLSKCDAECTAFECMSLPVLCTCVSVRVAGGRMGSRWWAIHVCIRVHVHVCCSCAVVYIYVCTVYNIIMLAALFPRLSGFN